MHGKHCVMWLWFELYWDVTGVWCDMECPMYGDVAWGMEGMVMMWL